MNEKVSLEVNIGDLRLKNPVLTASGTFGYGLEFTRFFDISKLGGFCTKGLSLEPMPGNAPERIAETPAGMLNAIGLENVGTEKFLSEKLPSLEAYDTHVIANIFGKTIEEFIAITARLNPYPKVSAYELNISCPNIEHGGIEFGHDRVQTDRVVRAVKRVSQKPCNRHQNLRTNLRGGGCGCSQSGQHLRGYERRCRAAPGRVVQPHRWPFRTRYSPLGGSPCLRGVSGCRDSGNRYRRYRHRSRCSGIHARRSHSYPGGHRQLSRPAGLDQDRSGASGILLRTPDHGYQSNHRLGLRRRSALVHQPFFTSKFQLSRAPRKPWPHSRKKLQSRDVAVALSNSKSMDYVLFPSQSGNDVSA